MTTADALFIVRFANTTAAMSRYAGARYVIGGCVAIMTTEAALLADCDVLDIEICAPCQAWEMNAQTIDNGDGSRSYAKKADGYATVRLNNAHRASQWSWQA